jgi:hypothetical protein
MAKAEIEGVFERVRTWPEERQAEAAMVLLSLEADQGEIYILSEEERRDLDEAEAEIARGEVASKEEVAELFARFRAP